MHVRFSRPYMFAIPMFRTENNLSRVGITVAMD
jgi:hypothetical protein